MSDLSQQDIQTYFMTGHAGFWKIEYKDQQDPKLYADDDMDTCTSIAKMLRQMGVRSEWTVSGKEAIIRAKLAKEIGDDFYAYIIDWLMPDMNGIETVRRIRSEIGDTQPIIILTAYDWNEIEQEAKEAGVTTILKSPYLPPTCVRFYCIQPWLYQKHIPRIRLRIVKGRRFSWLKITASIKKLPRRY